MLLQEGGILDMFGLNFRALGAVMVGAVAVVGFAHGGKKAKVVSDMLAHLAYAKQDVSVGNANKAMAHITLVLLNRPLKIRADYSGLDRSKEADCKSALSGATGMWKQALGEESFTTVAPKESADIVIHFVNNLDQSGQELSGLVHWKRSVYLYQDTSAAASTTAEVWIRTIQPNGKKMGVEHMRAAMAHEFGHILGLADSDSDGIMGEMDLARPAQYISSEEIQTLLGLRQEALQLYASLRSNIPSVPAKPVAQNRFKLGV